MGKIKVAPLIAGPKTCDHCGDPDVLLAKFNIGRRELFVCHDCSQSLRNGLQRSFRGSFGKLRAMGAG